MANNSIIVGVDGTESSNAAIDWAVGEAGRRRLPLRVVHVLDWDWPVAQYDFTGEYLDKGRSGAEAIVTGAHDRAWKAASGFVVDTDVLIGYPAQRLLEAARDAELVVLGHRGRGGFAGLRLGSVSQRVATHAPCPVVVVRGRTDADGPVVAGVDESPAAELVLESAFAAAAGRGCPLVVLRSYLPAIPLWLADVRPADVDTPEQDATECADLEARLEPWRGKYPQVPVEVVLTRDSPAAALVEASGRARLVVVGGRGHGQFAGTLLGSAGLQLLHHADCPVHIMRPRLA
jgi:nucleotide-binding universal stress UspA family protein